ncbi:hypothetical protein PIB30_099666 [Stylosanthes scabra]|uniref:Uncharacterized protein n=1 Tax=Stylosanthes scabra TaxID=79078 RepID=A0ABU6ZVL6_9FABA|nr:hypothetical protein [Stylosanthes scabra]
MGWGFSIRISQTFQVQVQAWKVAKHVFTSRSRVSVVPQYRPNASAARTSLEKQPVIVLALEKAGDKESVAVPREPEKAELAQRDLADSDEYFHFTPPSFKLLSQDKPQL